MDTNRPSGLSPLARGTPVCHVRNVHLYRFIPAGAGNTMVITSISLPPTVYPRWRGEHSNHTARNSGVCGLSPLARGTRLMPVNSTVTARFIPAGAGNTHYKTRNTRSSSVYPRWRGEHFEENEPAALARGLSPLARGTPTETTT